jgi:hypothetical protein
MAEQGFKDTDKGMKKALEEMKKLSEMHIEVGFPKGSGTVKNEKGKEVDIAQIAYWNEYGATSTENVLKKGKLWELPPRPFMQQAADNNESQIMQTGEKLVKNLASGKIDAETVIQKWAIYWVSLVKESIAKGIFDKNSPITIYGTEGKKERVEVVSKKGRKYKKTIIHQFIKGKGEGKKPLTDEGTMKKMVNAVVVHKGMVLKKIT